MDAMDAMEVLNAMDDDASLFTIPVGMVQLVTPGMLPSAPVAPEVTPESEFARALEWVGTGLERMEQLPDDQTREEIFALLDGIDAVHRIALGRLMDRLIELGSMSLVAQLTRDPMIQTVLEMYDLITVDEPDPVDERTQVEQALTSVYPYMESHGGHLEVLGVDEGRVRVRLSGSCGDCPGSAGTLTRVVEVALREGFPGFRALVVEEPLPVVVAPSVPARRSLRRPRWVTVGQMDDLLPGELRAVWPEGDSLLLTRLGDEVYAFRDGCPPGSPLTLHTGQLDGTTLICPWHGCRYDIRTGKRLDAEGKLEVLPVAVHDGAIKIAVGTEEVGSE